MEAENKQNLLIFINISLYRPLFYAHAFPGYFRIRQDHNLVDHLPHLTVNLSMEFVDSMPSFCTNTKEETWNDLKIKISPRDRTR
ncbi:hypothetical protein HZS_936 [Henneguya salminicola]|nr:hypothetical protein HZS_936 [Henneguya salminicola]